MKIPIILFTLIFAGLISIACLNHQSKEQVTTESSIKNHSKQELKLSMIQEKCIKCHGPEKQKGKVRLDQLSLGKISKEKLELIKESMELIKYGDMPPKKEAKLSTEEKAQLSADFTKILNDNLEEGKEENRVVYKRLTNSEYLNTVSELFDFDPKMFNPTVFFPEDQREEGVNRIGHELKSSEFLTEEYLQAANDIVEKTVRFDKVPKVKRFKYPVKRLSTRLKTETSAVLYASFYSGDNIQGAEIYVKSFKAKEDGFYLIKVLAEPKNQRHSFPRKVIHTDQEEPLRLGIKTGHHSNPNVRAVFDLKEGKNWYECRVWLNKGETPQVVYPNGIYSAHNLRFTLNNVPDIHKTLNIEKKQLLNDGDRGYIYHNIYKVVNKLKIPKVLVSEVNIEGPFYNDWNPEHNPKVLGKEKLSENNWVSKFTTFAAKAFRTPVLTEDLQPYLKLINSQKKKGFSLQEAYKAGLKALLCSPRFLFQNERQAQLSSYELATRLSYFLWSSMPDKELMDAAKANKLGTKPQILAQVERMLKDQKANNFVKDFTAAWLQLNDLGGVLPHTKNFKPFYHLNIQESFKKETYLYFKYILDENRDITEFIDSDYTIIDRRMSSLYKLPATDQTSKVFAKNEYSGAAPSTAFTKYKLNEQRRGGLMGHASILTVSANGVDTSPVVRGVWILEKLLCNPPPPAPTNVPAIEPDTRGAKSLKDRLKKHQDDDNCASCHKKIDPIGFALENFDPIGQWRHKYRRKKVDPSGIMNGQEFDDIRGLKKILLSQKDKFTDGFSEKLLTYALGRKVTFLDEKETQEILKEFKVKKRGLRDLIRLICTSKIFTQK